MKITIAVELDVPEEATAEDIQRFVRRIRSDAEWAYRTWHPKVSVLLPTGVGVDDARDTTGRRALHS